MSAEQPRRGGARHWWLAAGAGCYVVAGAVGVVVGAHTVGYAPLWWVLYGVGLFALLFALGGVEVGAMAGVFVLLLTGLSYFVGSAAWDDLVLRQRGRTVTAVVVKERVERGSRGDETWYYELIHRDGMPVPGPELKSDSDRFRPGRTVRVIEDPDGRVAPNTPGQADPTGDLLGAGGALAVALGGVVWAAVRGRKGKEGSVPLCPGRKKRQDTASGDIGGGDLEQRLRIVLRARNVDRRGYVRVWPGDYPGMTYQRAAAIAREEGLRAEAFGNRGSWRFGEQVVEEVE